MQSGFSRRRRKTRRDDTISSNRSKHTSCMDHDKDVNSKKPSEWKWNPKEAVGDVDESLLLDQSGDSKKKHVDKSLHHWADDDFVLADSDEKSDEDGCITEEFEEIEGNQSHKATSTKTCESIKLIEIGELEEDLNDEEDDDAEMEQEDVEDEQDEYYDNDVDDMLEPCEYAEAEVMTDRYEEVSDKSVGDYKIDERTYFWTYALIGGLFIAFTLYFSFNMLPVELIIKDSSNPLKQNPIEK